MNKTKQQIFKKASVTYYTASLFFPPKIKEDIFTLYAFVRLPDDYVDKSLQNPGAFYDFKNAYYAGLKGKKSGNEIIDSFITLQKRKRFEQEWIDAFLSTMESDIHKQTFTSLKQLEKYMYGSAEVIGLLIASVLELPKASYPYAQMLGRSMQYINFIRDINEDNENGRTYIPQQELEKFGFTDLSFTAARKNPSAFGKLIRKQITTYYTWQDEAEKGFRFIPRRLLLPIKTASDMYKWTASVIEKNPMIVFQKKVKPSPARVIVQYGKNAIMFSPSLRAK